MLGHFRTALVTSFIAMGFLGCNKHEERQSENTTPPATTPEARTNPNAASTGANTPGANGMNGANGAPGVNGTPGANGTNGTTGTSAQRVADSNAKDVLSQADKDMKEVLDEFAALGGKPLETLTPAEARKQPTLADAEKALLKKQGKSTEPEAVAKVENKTIRSGSASIPARIYTPKEGKAPYPVVVYFHGGGFVVGSNDSYDASARGLANGAKAVVVSVDYRKAPESKFPAAYEDADAAYAWVLKNAASFSGDPKNVAVAGESAGGNLAINVAIDARDKSEQMPVHLLAVYPVATATTTSPTFQEYAEAKPLDRAMMTWFIEKYTRTPADAKDHRLDLLNAKLTGLPPTTIITAELDPLRADDEALEKKLDDAKVSVKLKNYEGMTHEFFGLGAVVSDAKDAMDFATSRLKDAFEKHANQSASADTTR
jgi:acetyl esterase/lipase